MRPLLTIARNAFVESLRQPIVLVVVLLSGVLQYLNTAMSAYSMGYRTFAGEVTGDNKLLFDIGMGTMFICGILVASFIATAIVSREIENKTVLTVVSKPINRASVVIGKHSPLPSSLQKRIRLLDRYVAQSVLWGSSSWVLTRRQETILTRHQRRMLGFMIRFHLNHYFHL